jgi:putative NADH-flavin reductase
MNITVIAASGRLGRMFVAEALNAGHTVTAGVRSTSAFTPHDRLTVLHCDATNSIDVKRLVEGKDAVVSAIGHVRGSAADVQTVATKVLVEAMEQLSVRRFVTVTGTGVRTPGDRVPFLDRVGNSAISFVDPERIRDGKKHVEVLRESTADWTVIRVLKLQNGNAAAFELSLHGPTKLIVSRMETAQAMLRVLERNEYVRELPIITAGKR